MTAEADRPIHATVASAAKLLAEVVVRQVKEELAMRSPAVEMIVAMIGRPPLLSGCIYR